MSSDYISEYFTNATDPSKEGYWRPRYMDGDPDAIRRLDEVVAAISDAETVLDVGCGYHPFKGRIKNLVGIDKYNPAADIVIDMMDYNAPAESFDVVLALGSTNLHGLDLISKQIEKVISWCKPGGRIFMRVNPVLETIISPKQDVYPWTLNDIQYFTQLHDLQIIKPVELTEGMRYEFIWQK